MDEKIKNMFNEINEVINDLKCCGNCLRHDVDETRGNCSIKKILTHGCYYCDSWEPDNLLMRERKNFELPKD